MVAMLNTTNTIFIFDALRISDSCTITGAPIHSVKGFLHLLNMLKSGQVYAAMTKYNLLSCLSILEHL